MRLLHVVPTYYPAVRYGGPIRSVHGLCAALAARGHDVHVCTTNVDGPGNSDVPLGQPVVMDGVKVWYFPSRRMRRLYWSPPMAASLRQDVEGFDLLHLHSVFLWPTWAAARAARRARIPYVVSPRGMLVRDLFRERSYVAKSVWFALVERTTIARAAAIHVTSAAEGRELLKFGAALPKRVFEIPNGVASGAGAGTVERSPVPYVLMLGRVSWKKRIELAIDAMNEVQGVRLVVAGGDDEGLVPMLRSRAASLGVESRVEFVGPVEGRRTNELLGGALALLMPSISENFGNSALEALAVGTPAIVTPEVGVAEVIASSGAGIVAESSATGIAAAVRRLAMDRSLRDAMGRRGIELVARSFTWPRIAARMEAEYQTILAATPART